MAGFLRRLFGRLRFFHHGGGGSGHGGNKKHPRSSRNPPPLLLMPPPSPSPVPVPVPLPSGVAPAKPTGRGGSSSAKPMGRGGGVSGKPATGRGAASPKGGIGRGAPGTAPVPVPPRRPRPLALKPPPPAPATPRADSTTLASDSCDGRQGGFGIRVTVPVSRGKCPPIIYQCTAGKGGVQGLKWYVERLQMDEDGDIAQEFLDEVMPQNIGGLNNNTTSRKTLRSSLVVKMQTRPIKAKGPLSTANGNLHQSAEI